jgi:8-oxo-dGTP pyrophosphatase MutT (NUDIX family)
MEVMPDLTALREALDADPDHEPAPGDRAAAVLALIVLEPRPAVLFTERTVSMSRHPGEVSFPGGLRDPGDAGLVHTALRETAEEVGIGEDLPDVLGALPPIHTFVSSILVTPVVATIGTLPALTISDGEIARAFTIPVATLARVEERRELHGDEHGVIHGWWYETGGGVVWGATGFMVHDLLNTIKEEASWMVS